MRKSFLIPFLAIAAATMAQSAQASSDNAAIPQANWMTVPQITEKLTAEGYKVRQIKKEKHGYEVYAIDKDGKRLEAYVDPVTGQLLGAENGEND